MISINSLHKSYGKQAVLNGINLTFEPGKIYGIVGENGAGKTTLFKCISGLEPFQGAINYPEVLKDVCGFLPTNPFFFSKITGQEYLQLLCNARKIKLEAVAEKNMFNLPLHRYAETYSTGMKKKLALTGMLLQQNQVFILDEPFNGVDIQSNMLIQEIIKHLKNQGKIILIASHIFASLNALCDVLHFIQNGYIANTATRGDFKQIEQQMSQNFLNDKVEQFKSWL